MPNHAQYHDDDPYTFPNRPVVPVRDAFFDDSADPWRTAEQRADAAVAAGANKLSAKELRDNELALTGDPNAIPPLPSRKHGKIVTTILWAFQTAGWLMLGVILLALTGHVNSSN